MIEVEGLQSLKANLEKVAKELGAAGNKAVQAVALDIVAEAKDNIDKNRTNAFGTLRKSGKVQKAEDGTIDAGFFSSEHDNGYAAYVEFGRGPTKKGNQGGPTLKDSLKAWVRKKLGGSAMRSAAVFNLMDEEGKLVRKGAKAIKKSEEELIEAAALNIARKIHKHGTKPQPFFAPAVKKIEDRFEEIVSRYIKKESKNV